MSKSDPGTLGFGAFGPYTFGTLTLGTLGMTEPALAWPVPMKTVQRAAETVTSLLALILSLPLQPPACASLKIARRYVLPMQRRAEGGGRPSRRIISL